MKQLNLPNKITLARIALIPIVVILYFVNFPYHEIAACIVFMLCCSTDFIDGNIARKRNLVTDLGKFLDPIADKVIVVIMLFVFVGDGTLPGWYNQIIAGVIISREIIITAFRIIAVQKKRRACGRQTRQNQNDVSGHRSYRADDEHDPNRGNRGESLLFL